MASRTSAAVKSRLRCLVFSGSSDVSSANPRVLGGGNINNSRPAPLLLPRRQRSRNHCAIGSSNKPASFGCLSSTLPSAAAAVPRSWPYSLLFSAREHGHLRQQPAFCTQSTRSGRSDSSSNDSNTRNFDVHVTHVDAATAQAAEAGPKMMPEEDRQPVGAGSTEQGSEAEPNIVRFLDVPGSEQTREEKMSIVFTCTVCETRTAKTFAKLSYEKGVVLARCPGCHNLHLIADRLGWFEEAGDGAEGWDIEKITNRIGESDCHVVNEDNVMELNLVDIVGKTTKQKEAPPKGRGESD